MTARSPAISIPAARIAAPGLARPLRAATAGGLAVGVCLVAGSLGLADRLAWWNQAVLAVSALMALFVTRIGLEQASRADRDFHRAVFTGVAAWTVFQGLMLLEAISGRDLPMALEQPVLAVIGVAAALCWRAAVHGHMSTREALAVYLDSAILFSTAAAGVLLAFGTREVLDSGSLYRLLFATVFLGMVGSTIVLNLALTPLRRPGGWAVATVGLVIVGLAFADGLAIPRTGGWSGPMATVAMGVLVTVYGCATWTSAKDPSAAYRALAHRVREALPLLATAAAPVLLIANELLGERDGTPGGWAVDPLLALVLVAVVVRQTILLRERDRVVEDSLAAAGREADLHADLEASEGRLQALVTNSSDVFLIIHTDGTIVYHSPAVERVLGHQVGTRVGRRIFETIHPEDAAMARSIVAELAAEPASERSFELRTRHANGTWRTIEATGRNLTAEPSIGGIVINYRDVTDRKRLEEQLQHEAFHDPLTGLANRALFMDRLDHAIIRREGSQGLTVMLLDLDDFKTINDSVGPVAGDEVLRSVSERLRGALRPEDTVARLGGDEFAVLVENSEPATIGHLGQRLLDAFRAPFEVGLRRVHLNVSIGAVQDGTAAGGAEELLRDADVAMNTAKSNGKGRVEVFEASMHAAVVSRLELKSDLERAVERGEFRIHYQPIFQLDTGRLAWFEALVRWNHPERGEVPPSGFMPLAEETGLIHPIGAWVLEEACRQAQAWRANHAPDIRISVNLSSRQLRDPEIVRKVAVILNQTGLDPDALDLELTESSILTDDEGRLTELRSLGLHLALDDFGTGYSSLSYLSRFPIDSLKIDRSFTAKLGRPDEETALVRSVIQLAASMNMQTVAEGIERPEQLARVRELGCNYGQGFLLARPMDAAQAELLLGGSQHEAMPAA